ncbi:hypothetical protein [Shimia biformata]|uniref:hypothetical protein n=1 Tax=Shimia biformata TaxID=1294299 RepID=UPI001951B97A|nr:hypothetical protein [Shimia biformata]
MTRFKGFIGLAVSAALLSACAPARYESFYKAGVSDSRAQRDRAACEKEALTQIPAAYMPIEYPSTYVGAGTYGWGLGVGYTFTPRQDVNASARNRYRQQCMIEKGYAPVIVPICSQAQTQAVSGQSRISAGTRPTETTCATQTTTGVALVDPG